MYELYLEKPYDLRSSDSEAQKIRRKKKSVDKRKLAKGLEAYYERILNHPSLREIFSEAGNWTTIHCF